MLKFNWSMKRLLLVLIFSVWGFLFPVADVTAEEVYSSPYATPQVSRGVIFNPEASQQEGGKTFENTGLQTSHLSTSQTVRPSYYSLAAAESYVLGPSDLLNLNIISKKNELNLTYPINVSVDGRVFIPTIGEFYVSGLKLAQFKRAIIKRIRTFYRYDFSLSLILVESRSIRVLVTGNVAKPGPIVIKALSKVSDVINMVGGVLAGGSTRNVEIERGAKKIAVDLFRLFKFGDVKQDKVLESGDIIQVPFVSQVVEVRGEVYRPGHYEIKKGETVKDLIHLAGGLTQQAVFTQGVLFNREKETKKVMIKEGQKLFHNDIIYIPGKNKKVQIIGGVEKPGIYELLPGMKVKDLVTLAGGVRKSSALSEVVYLERQLGKDEYEEKKLNLHDLFLKGDESQNFSLEDGDIITIPEVQNFVYLYGEVEKPGKITYLPGRKFSEYINEVGGPLANANLKDTRVVRSEGGKSKVIRVDGEKIIYQARHDLDVELKGGDVVHVPGKFFYFKDFSSFTSLILTGVALFSVLPK